MAFGYYGRRLGEAHECHALRHNRIALADTLHDGYALAVVAADFDRTLLVGVILSLDINEILALLLGDSGERYRKNV